MEFYLDSADLDMIKKYAKAGLISGVTTNPTLIAKNGKDFNETIMSIVKEGNCPVSVEIMSENLDEMVDEAERFHAMNENFVIKIPVTPLGLQVTSILSKKGIPVNVTLVFSSCQALLAARSGAAYVSPFVGRLDDIGENGVDLVEEIVKLFKLYTLETKVIAASIRSVDHVRKVALAGAHIATVPPDIFSELFMHSLTDKGISRFKDDWHAFMQSEGGI